MIKRMVSFWLVLVLALGLCACGQEEPLAGTWQTEVDIADYLTETMGLDYMVEQFVIRMQLSFENDGTVTVTYDREYMNQQQKEMADNMWIVMMQMHGDDLGMDPSEVEKILIDSGWSPDDLVAAMGLDKIIAQLEDVDGRWTLKEDQLYIDLKEAENTAPIQIALNNDRFSMIGGEEGVKALFRGVITEGRIGQLLPIVFERT